MFTELELNVAVTPAGAALTLSATPPLKPFSGPTLTVELALLPTITDNEFGLADRVKSWVAFMFNATWAVCVALGFVLAPVIVRVKLPAATPLVVVMFKVEDPAPPLIELELNVPAAPEGKPLTLSATFPVKPFTGLTETV